MATKIQIHTLTSHSTHNLNRDDLGQPKSVNFLGENRGRISSQCLKKNVRDSLKATELHGKTATRTRKLPQLVKAHLEENEVSPKLVKLMVTEIASLGTKNKAKDDTELTQLIFLTQAEIDEVKALALELCKECEGEKLGDTKKEFKKRIDGLNKSKKFSDGVDVAMFGRMTTSEVFENCDASIQVAHAITTSPIKSQDDFFTAVDDLTGDEETGSGHMDEKHFNTGIFYKYATIDFDQLTANLNNDSVLAKQATLAFLKSFVIALPTGNQNGMAAHQHPFTVFVTVGEGANTNLANAFASLPKSSKDHPFEVVTNALVKEHQSEVNFYGDLKKVDCSLLAVKDESLVDKKNLGGIDCKNSLNELWEILEENLAGKADE